MCKYLSYLLIINLLVWFSQGYHWETRLCMCKYLSYSLIIQLLVWFSQGYHWETRLCMCKYPSYLLIIQLWVWMWSGIPLGYTTLHVKVPVLFIDYAAMGVYVVRDTTGIHNSACVSTCLIYLLYSYGCGCGFVRDTPGIHDSACVSTCLIY